MTKIIPFRSDRVDEARCFNRYGPSLERCFGGRLVWPGYVCPHCDSENPPSRCSAPAPDAVPGMEAYP